MKKIFTLILSLALVQAFGQTPAIVMQVVSSSGGYYKDATSGLNISWTLGEPVIETLSNSGANLMITQGFQQGNLFMVDAPNPVLPSLSLRMYPNPAINKIWFEVNNQTAKGEFTVEVYDITGRKILNQELGEFINQEAKEFSVANLKSGIYLVKVKIGNFNSDIIKLIKE
jgi:hypothetical protein